MNRYSPRAAGLAQPIPCRRYKGSKSACGGPHWARWSYRPRQPEWLFLLAAQPLPGILDGAPAEERFGRRSFTFHHPGPAIPRGPCGRETAGVRLPCLALILLSSERHNSHSNRSSRLRTGGAVRRPAGFEPASAWRSSRSARSRRRSARRVSRTT